jgi:hypothetical protein
MTSKRYRALAGALLITTMLGAGAVVYAQTGGPVWDASQLPETRGTVKQYTITPRGDVDGLILNDGTEIKLPPHLTAQIVFAVKPGDAVTVRGLKARALPLVDAASVTNVATGAAVVDSGPPGGPGGSTTETTLTGKVAAALHGKRGEVNGALLENGTVLRMPPPEAERFQSFLAQGRAVAVRGVSVVTPLGTVVDVRAIGSSAEKLTELTTPPPRGGPKGGPKGPKGEPKHKGPGRGPAEFAPPPPPEPRD